MKKYTLAIIIGRFQPMHWGHYNLFERAAQLADYCLVAVGSSYIARDPRNPFRYVERAEFIKQSVQHMFKHVTTVPMIDDLYDDTSWAAQLQEHVRATGKFKNSEVVIVAHDKTDVDYLDLFPQWDKDLDLMRVSIDATTIRNLYFEGGIKAVNEKAQRVPIPVREFLEEFEKTPAFKNMVDYHKFIKDYRRQFEDPEIIALFERKFGHKPYQVPFVTADAVLTSSAHILLVTRKSQPGKDLLAFPGGFFEYLKDDSPEDAIFRELHEEVKGLPKDLKLIGPPTVYAHKRRSLRGRVITHVGRIKIPDHKLLRVYGADDARKKGTRFYEINDVFNRPEDWFEDHLSIAKRELRKN